MTKSVSDFVASTMDAVLKSESHNRLFGLNKTANDKNHDEACAKDHKDDEDCAVDGKSDDDDREVMCASDAESEDFKEKFPEAYAWLKAQEEFPLEMVYEKFPSAAKVLDEEVALADDDLEVSAYDTAIDSLLTASAALDNVGSEKEATLVLKIASLVVEAKKSKKDDKDADKAKAAKEKEKEKKAKEKAKKDEQAAKDKAKAAKEKEKAKAAKEKEAEKKAKEKAKKDEQAAKDKAKKDAEKAKSNKK